MSSKTKICKGESKYQKLPTNVKPSNYNICLKPDIENSFFEGCAIIDLEIKRESKFIVLNAVDLKISKIQWEESETEDRQEPVEFICDDEKETLKIIFEPALMPGFGALKINFSGTISDRMEGFYRMNYIGLDGQKKVVIGTLFHSTDARRCFPCWDEPSIKCSYNLSLIIPKNLSAISNMPVRIVTSHRTKSDLRVVEFVATPKLPTYLVNIVIGEFEYIEEISQDGVICRVYTRTGKREQGRFALSVCVRALLFYKSYFGIKFPFPKVNLMAIRDESSILHDPGHSSVQNCQSVALAVCNELAHIWLENLASMEWWSGLWVIDGLCGFLDTEAVDNLFPEYQIWTQYYPDAFIPALKLDCLKNIPPIEVAIDSPDEIDSVYDEISYNKGSALFRVLKFYLGETSFKRAIHIYLSRWQSKSVKSDELWVAFEEGSNGKPVKKIMKGWTSLSSFPILKVHCRQEENNRIFTITQNKFKASKTDPYDEKAHWIIPLSFTSGENPSKSILDVLMESKSMTVSIPNIGKNQWVKLNAGAIGYYRVKYPADIMANFIPAIRSKTMSSVDRSQLLDDLFALSQAGRNSTVEVLSLLESFIDENDYTCWSTIDLIIERLDILLEYTGIHEKFRAFGKHLYKNILRKVGWAQNEGESYKEILLRSKILNRMVSFGHNETVLEAKSRLEQYFVKNGEIPLPDIRGVIYSAAFKFGNEEIYRSMMKIYKTTDSHDEKERVGEALKEIKNEDWILKFTEFALSSDTVLPQDTLQWMKNLSVHKKGRENLWNFLKANVKEIENAYGNTFLSTFVTFVTQNFASEDMIYQIQEFSKDNSALDIEPIIESIRKNEFWLKSEVPLLKDYLLNY